MEDNFSLGNSIKQKNLQKWRFVEWNDSLKASTYGRDDFDRVLFKRCSAVAKKVIGSRQQSHYEINDRLWLL